MESPFSKTGFMLRSVMESFFSKTGCIGLHFTKKESIAGVFQ